MSNSTTSTDEVMALAKSELAELDRRVQEVADAKKRVQQQEESFKQKLADLLCDKVISFTGSLEAEDMFGQDGIEMYMSHSHLVNERLVVTNVFLEETLFSSQKIPIIYAVRERYYPANIVGGRVSFKLLNASKIEIVE